MDKRTVYDLSPFEEDGIIKRGSQVWPGDFFMQAVTALKEKSGKTFCPRAKENCESLLDGVLWNFPAVLSYSKCLFKSVLLNYTVRDFVCIKFLSA